MATENKQEKTKDKPFINWLNRAGQAWKDFWDTPVTVKYAYNPHAVVGNNGAPFSSTQRRGDFATQAAGALAVPATAVGVSAIGIPATVIGMGVGIGAGEAGSIGGSKLVELVGGDENAQEMVGDIAGFALGTLAGGKATKTYNYYSNLIKSGISPKSIYTTMSEALTPVKTSSAGIWTNRGTRSAKISEAERLGIPKGERNLKIKPDTNWDPESWFSYRLDKQWTPEDARILAEHVPEYREIEKVARLNKTFMKFPDGTPFLGDPREWIMMMSQNGKNVFNPLQNSDIIPSGIYRSGVRNMENATLAYKYKRALTMGNTEEGFKYDPLSKDIEVWNGTDRSITKAFGQNSDLSYDVSDFNITDPKILERINKAEIIKSNEAKFLSDLLGFDVDPSYAGNIHLEAYVGNAKELGLTEKQLINAIKQQELFRIAYNKALWPDTDVTYTSLYPVSSSKGKVYVSPDGKMRNWSEILLDDGTMGVTDDAVKEAIRNGYDFTIIKNVREGGMDKAKLNELLNHDLIIHSGTPRVSFLGNNGNLTGVGGVYYKSGGSIKIKKKNKGKFSKVRDYIDYKNIK